MLTFKAKVLKQIGKTEDKLNDVQHLFQMVRNKLRYIKEEVEEIRTVPKTLGTPKPATTIEDLEKIMDIKYGLKTWYDQMVDQLSVEVCMLKDTIKNEYIRVEEQLKKAKQDNGGYGTYKSKEGVTIMEVNELKFDE